MVNYLNNQFWLVDMNLVTTFLGDDEFPLRREVSNPRFQKDQKQVLAQEQNFGDDGGSRHTVAMQQDEPRCSSLCDDQNHSRGILGGVVTSGGRG